MGLVWAAGQPGRTANGAALRVALLLACTVYAGAQSPDAQVSGIVTSTEGRPLPQARIVASQAETGFSQGTSTDSNGGYSFLALVRGHYSIRAEKDGFHAVERRGIELAAGAKLEINFALSELSPATGERSVNGLLAEMPPTLTLPVETFASSVSVVIDENRILRLPLASRNIYGLFLLQPGVTSHGAIAARGLSFSVHGQRVSGSNYLLDGVENNNIVLTGPVAAASAEAIQEFRMVNSSFSAKDGRATGFVAQVVTRSGGNRFHGGLYEFFSHDALSANTFQNNASGEPKPPLRLNQFGYAVGGPIQPNRTFFESALEISRLRFGGSHTDRVPTASYIAQLPEGSIARQLLTQNPPIPSTPTPQDPSVGIARYQFSNHIDTMLATERLDRYFSGGRDRLAARYSLAATSEEPAQDWLRGYPGLMPDDRFRAHNSLFGWTHSWASGPIHDVRLGWSRERISMPRPRNDLPILQSADGAFLPGSLRQSGLAENNNVIQITDSFAARRGRAAWTAGFEYRRNFENGLTLGLQNEQVGGEARALDGIYLFPNLAGFAQARPLAFLIAVDRFSSGALRLPDLRRRYRSNDFALYVQNELAPSRRLSLTVGLRYEYFGVPHNTDPSRDVNFYFGPGATIEERLARGVLRSIDQNPGDLKNLLYRRDRLNFAPSFSLAWDPLGRGRTVIRGGYAVALDRVLDTARDLRTNSQELVSCSPPSCTPRFLLPVAQMLPFLNQSLPPSTIVQLDESLRTPYAQNWYIGVQQSLGPDTLVEVRHAGSVGRKLLSRDQVNRILPGAPRLNSGVLEDTFLSNAGNSNYLALEAGLNRRFAKGLQYQVSYTYSHAIDNQSDIFEGVRTGPDPASFALATFTRQFDAQVDRGNASFDQRQNLIFNAIWDLPAPRGGRGPGMLLGGWTISAIGGYRTGFPVTAIGSVIPSAAPGLRNNRLDFVGDSSLAGRPASLLPVPGGVQWQDPAAFRPAADHVGTLGRGALRGPGFWNYDFALIRTFTHWEAARVQFRAEFYNLFNHANLSTPVSRFLSSSSTSVDPEFGRAYYGRNRTFSRFGDFPLENSARRVQFAVRVHF